MMRPDIPSAAGLGEALACPERSRKLLQDSGDAQIIGMVPVGALRGGVAEPFGQAALAEQPGRLPDEVVEIVKDQHLFSDREQLWNGGAELSEHRGAAAAASNRRAFAPLTSAGCM